MILDVLAIIIGFILLIKGSDFFVDGSSSLARRFGIPQIIIGLTIVAMGTSAPELAVSLTAVIEGTADISIGNIIGSNILNVLVILGIASVLTPIVVNESTIKYDIPIMITISIVLTLLGLDGALTLVDALILLALFAGYLVYLFKSAKKNKEEVDEEAKEISLLRQLLYIVFGMAAVIIGAKLAVEGAVALATLIGISERVIGLTIIALGTSLPELVITTTAARKGHAELAIGNIVGSNIFNALFILGVTGCIKPIAYASSFITDSIIMIGAGVLLYICSLKNRKLNRVSGIIMLLCTVAYLIYLI